MNTCPSCGADPRLSAKSCWLCRYPLPDHPTPQPPDFVPPPPLYEAGEDRRELDVTSVLILVGLVMATIGAFATLSPMRNALGALALIPLAYLFFWLTFDRGPSQKEQGYLRRVLKGIFLLACIIVLVSLALVVAGYISCMAIMFGLSLNH